MLLFFAVDPVINAAMSMVINPGFSSNSTKKYSKNIQYKQNH